MKKKIKNKKLYGSLTVISLLMLGSLGVLAASSNTNIFRFGDQSDAGNSSYNTKLQTFKDANLRLIDKDNDLQMPGNKITGKYFDSGLGFFNMSHPSINSSVVIGNQITSRPSECSDLNQFQNVYEMSGYAYSDFFGIMDFSGAYLCEGYNTLDGGGGGNYPSIITGYAYSPYFGIQALDIRGDAIIDFLESEESRGLRVEGITASKNGVDLLSGDQFKDDIYFLGGFSKVELRKKLHEKVYEVIRGLDGSPLTSNPTIAVNDIGNTGTTIIGGKGSYYEGNGTITLNGGEISGSKTLIVRGGNIYIKNNIFSNTGSAKTLPVESVDTDNILGLIALTDEYGKGGNIYIDPDVTDLHAIIYADRAMLSYSNAEGEILEGTNAANGEKQESEISRILNNQLFIYGSLFTENTIGGGDTQRDNIDSTLLNDFRFPYFVDLNQPAILGNKKGYARKYDLNYLRRYRLVEKVDINGNVIDDGSGNPELAPAAAGSKSYGAGDERNKHSVVIQYDPRIQYMPPPLFD